MHYCITENFLNYIHPISEYLNDCTYYVHNTWNNKNYGGRGNKCYLYNIFRNMAYGNMTIWLVNLYLFQSNKKEFWQIVAILE